MKHLQLQAENDNHRRRMFTVVVPNELAPYTEGETCLVRFSEQEANFRAEVSLKKVMRLDQVDHGLAKKSLGPQPILRWNKRSRRWVHGRRQPTRADLVIEIMKIARGKQWWRGGGDFGGGDVIAADWRIANVKINLHLTVLNAMAEHWYVEFDGKLFLISEGERRRLPTSEAELPFEFSVNESYEVGEERIYVCVASIPFPHDWAWKDKLPRSDDVDELVKHCIHASMTRLITRVACIEGDQVLMVKANRGLFKGQWTLPGGFLNWNESPLECARRELFEETGIEGTINSLHTIQSKTFPAGYHFVSLFYLAQLPHHEFNLPPDEIAEARWFSLADAIEITPSIFDKEGLGEIQGQGETGVEGS